MIQRKSHWVRGTVTVIAFQMVCTWGAGSASVGAQFAGPATSRVIVKFRPGIARDEQAAVVRANGHGVDKSIRQLDMHAIRVPPGRTAEQVIERYRRHPLVEFAEEETFKDPALAPNDPWFPNWQSDLQQMGADAAWDITTGSPDVPIAVLDTGLDTDHYEFVDRIARGEIFGYDFADDDPDFNDELGHGTATGGVIGALANNNVGIAGACWDNPLMVLRSAFGLDTIEAITWATDNGARVISMSFGGYTPTSWESAALQYAFDRGVVLVGAAGNEASGQPFYPAAYPTVLAVTGVRGNGRPVGYNWGDWIDLSAPGALTTARAEDDTNGDGLISAAGTSISAPWVAAAAGLVLSVNPDLAPTQVMDILRATADDVDEPGFDPLTGHGRVNFYAAVLEAANTSPPAPDTTPPTATIVSPVPNALLSGSSDVLVEATDNVRVTRVDLFVDGEFISGDSVAPHAWTLDTTTLFDGEHILSAIAYDAAGNAGGSLPVPVTIDNSPPEDVTPPTIVMVTPKDGEPVSGMVAVTVSATDDHGIDRVIYQVDDVDAAVAAEPPWSWQWDSATVDDGAHTITAIACDLADNRASSSVSVAVSNSPPPEPDPTPITETFEGSVNRRRPERAFDIVVSGEGTLEAEVTFGGRKNTLTGSIIDPSGNTITTVTDGSPLTFDPVAVAAGTYTVRVRKVSKNVSFTLTVTHP